MTEPTTNPSSSEQPASGTDESFGWTGDGGSAGGAAGGREWLAQLQSMIDQITEQAGPVLREVSAKAAELAAVAGEKAGPAAARAAELTAQAGQRLAERSRDLAAELRRDQGHADGDSPKPTSGTDTSVPPEA